MFAREAARVAPEVFARELDRTRMIELMGDFQALDRRALGQWAVRKAGEQSVESANGAREVACLLRRNCGRKRIVLFGEVRACWR